MSATHAADPSREAALERLLLVAVLACWALNARLVFIDRFQPDPFHFARGQSVFFWLALAGLAAHLVRRALVPGASSPWRDAAAVALAALVLFGTEAVVYERARYGDVYGSLRMFELTRDLERLPAAGTAYSYIHHFPGLILLIRTLVDGAGFAFDDLARWTPVFVSGLVALLVLVAGRPFLGPRAVVAALGTLALGWLNDFHLSPFAFTYLLSAAVAAMLLLALARPFPALAPLPLLALTGAVVVSHPANIVFLLGPAALLFALSRVLPERPRWRALLGATALFALVAWGAWLAVKAGPMLALGAAIALRVVGDLDPARILLRIFARSEVPADPTAAWILAGRLRLAATGLAVLLGAWLAAWSLRRGRLGGVAVSAWMVGISSWLLLAILLDPGLVGRAIIYSGVPLGILVGIRLSHEPPGAARRAPAVIVIAVLLAGLMLLMPLTRGAADPFEFRPASTIAAREFLVEHRLVPDTDYVYLAYPGFRGATPLDLERPPPGGFAPQSDLWRNYFATRYQAAEAYAAAFPPEWPVVYDSGTVTVHAPSSSSA